MKSFEELKATFTDDLPIDVLGIWEEDHKAGSGKKYTMIHCRYKTLSSDIQGKVHTAAFWSDSGDLQLDKIKPVKMALDNIFQVNNG